MFRRFRKLLTGAMVPVLLFGLTGMALASPSRKPMELTDSVRHELIMLPYLTLFDNLSFRIEGGNTVVLTGQVTRPVLKSDAENIVRRVEGVNKVVNDIEVLPLSPMDDSIRLATYRAIFSRPGFENYANLAVSPIRIIVKNGVVTLEGVVATQLDRQMAEMAARSVPLTFGVNNNLTVG